MIGSPLLILPFSIGPNNSNKKSTLPSQNFKLWDPETGFQHFWAGPLNFQEDACIYAGNKMFMKHQKLLFFRYFPTFWCLLTLRFQGEEYASLCEHYYSQNLATRCPNLCSFEFFVFFCVFFHPDPKSSPDSERFTIGIPLLDDCFLSHLFSHPKLDHLISILRRTYGLWPPETGPFDFRL